MDYLVTALNHFIGILLHLDLYLNAWAGWMGPWLYAVLFAVVFCETGLVVTPILPGDSLLFTLGAMTATAGATLSLPILFVLLIAAGFLGDLTNYTIGRMFGEKLFVSESSKLFNRRHLTKTQAFYVKHGARMVIFARFLPIVRTFAPFVAGMGKMRWRTFLTCSFAAGVSWVTLFLIAGRVFGNIPAVKKNFEIVILAIIVLSLVPVLIEAWKSRSAKTGPRGTI